jgi:PAS domain S-box-containing protein
MTRSHRAWPFRFAHLGAAWPPLVAAMAVLAALAGWSIVNEFDRQRERAGAQLQALSELRGTQVESWLSRQVAMAGFLSGGTAFAELFLRWRDQGDAAAGRQLLERVVSYRTANDADSVLIVDREGAVLASEHPEPSGPAAPGRAAAAAPHPALGAALTTALRNGAVAHSGLYAQPGATPVQRLDVVVPLLRTGTPARAALVVRFDVQRVLFPLLQRWPVPSASGESVLWRVAGDRLEVLSEMRLAAERDLGLDTRLATSPLPVALLLRDEARLGEAFAALDYRGEPVLASVRKVSGSDWYLVSKIDLDEVRAPAWDTTRWTLAAALLGMFALAAAARVWLQRQTLRRAEHDAALQAEKLRALTLLEALSESSADSIFAKDLQGRYVLVNRAMCERMGLPREALVGRTDAELFEPATAEQLRAHDLAAAEAAEPMVFDETIQGPQGRRVKRSTKGPLRDGSGRLIGVFGLARDVTDQQRAEQALRDSEAHYRSVVSVLAEGIVVIDPQGRVISCNPAGERLVGSAEGDWQGRSVVAPGWKVLREDGSEMPPEETPPGRVLAGAGPQRAVLLQTRRPDGETVWFEVAAQPVVSPDNGALLAVVTSFFDVTERKRLDDELRRHRSHLQDLVAERTRELQQAVAQLEDVLRFNRTITDTLPGRVAYWDRELRCRFANRTYFEWFGKTPEQVLGRTAAEIFGQAYFEANWPQIERTLAGEAQHFERETRRSHGDGSITVHFHQVHYIPDQRPGEPVRGMYVMAFDITELKRVQQRAELLNTELARSRDAAEAATRAKSAFLANMSHEIRTPMNAIIGLTHLMSRDTRDPIQRERLGKIDNAAQHLLQVINDILDLSKIEAGKMALDRVEFGLDEMLARCFEMVADRAREKGLELVLDTDHLPERLTGDPMRLSQALINLLSNAVKFTAAGWVRLRGQLLREEGQRLQVRFEVQDTGEGIALERQAGLFAAFEQADNTTTRRHGGTGLGLALTRHIARLMDGDAGVVSAPGQGSTFWFTAWVERAPEAGDRAAPVPLKGLRALLVDDLPEALAALSERLQLLGLQVDAWPDGAAALARMQEQAKAGRAYDVLLVDWRMAPLDGIRTLQALRDMLGDGMPPAVLVTAFDEVVMWQQARAIQVDAVLVKPITTSALHDTLARVLRRPGALLVAPPTPGEAEATLRRHHAGQRVLLAEDNPVNQEVAGELLRAAGLVVETAADGERAVELALARSYDLVLMDVQMPGVDGLAATRRIRERLGRGLPVIAMTAHAFGEDRAACLDAGMNDHVAKPVDPELLYATLLRWLPLRDDGRPPRGGSPAAGDAAAPHPAVQDERAPLPVRLAGVPGYDVAQGLHGVGGQMAPLARVLRLFVTTYAGGEPGLAGVAEGEDTAATLARWRGASHSIRGACATVGAVALQQHLIEFDKAMAAGVDLQALAAQARQLDEDLQALVARLGAELDG